MGIVITIKLDLSESILPAEKWLSHYSNLASSSGWGSKVICGIIVRGEGEPGDEANSN